MTIYYAFQNRSMVREMKRARDAALLPKLSLDFHRLGPTAMTLAIKNVGPGAALGVDVRAIWDPIAEGQAPERRWRRNVLAPGEQADFMPPGETLNNNLNSLPATYKRVRLQGTMRDAAGNEHAVDEVVEDLAEWREVPGAAHQRYVTVDAERRAAEELYKKFDRPLQDLRRSVEGIAAALAAFTPARSGDSDEIS